MNNRCLKTIFSWVIFFTLSKHIQAQWTGLVKYELGLSAGAFIYQGDLAPSDIGSYKTPAPLIAISGNRILNRAFGVRANLAVGGLKGDESRYDNPEYRKLRNFSFRSTLVELSAQLVWSPLGTNYRDKGLSPYLFGGGGVTYRHTTRDWSRIHPDLLAENSDLQAGLVMDAARQGPEFIPVVPLGVGLRYAITPKIALSAETNYRITFTDYVDGFSYSVNPDKRDQYHSHSIGVIYRFGRKNTLNCPVIRP